MHLPFKSPTPSPSLSLNDLGNIWYITPFCHHSNSLASTQLQNQLMLQNQLIAMNMKKCFLISIYNWGSRQIEAVSFVKRTQTELIIKCSRHLSTIFINNHGICCGTSWRYYFTNSRHRQKKLTHQLITTICIFPCIIL